MLKSKSRNLQHLINSKLWLKVLIGLLLGVIVGMFLGPDFGLVDASKSSLITGWLALPGYLFLALIKMIIIPLIFSSIIIGIISSGNPEFLKKIGPRLVVYFVITTVIATLIGLGVSLTINPGEYVDVAELTRDMSIEEYNVVDTSGIKNIPETIVGLLPTNPLEAMVRGDMLGIVIFTIIVGIALLFASEKHLALSMSFLEIVQDISMRIVRWAMYLIPYAVFGLMTQVTSKTGFKTLIGLGMYMLTVVIGLILLVLFYNLIILVFTNYKPKDFMSNIKDVQLLAFSTSSSAAVMPLSMKTAEDKLGVKQSISEFIIPVGATVNMDGTALYQVVATMFLAQAFGVHLSAMSLLLIIVLTVGASIGAPSAPGTGIIILATILESVGIPGIGIALILGVDRILDMCRTSVNVTGDLTACLYFNDQLAYLFEKKKE
ncbi:MAG: dicarboxylate/amino acid:cation symporter [Nanoarchaeota archaeon]|nr:dicarboxylate/amino acid:cation symporter [Nanoarchaeota archaeon]MBU1854814.1 dicarboxylate/amino acid:cation symporter [Nanoarchaeota archaeon]